MEIARVRARNTAPDSENRMHDDATAALYGFRGGLVPGVTVYGYLAAPLGDGFLESGGMRLRLLRPFYDGDDVIVDLEDDVITAHDSVGTVAASGRLQSFERVAGEIPEVPLPLERPRASRATLAPGRVLGTLRHTIEIPSAEALLELSNRVLMINVTLNPWIHAASDVQHFSRVEPGEPVSVRARVADQFEKKGHQFVVLDVVVAGGDGRLVQQVRHTAIFEPKRG